MAFLARPRTTAEEAVRISGWHVGDELTVRCYCGEPLTLTVTEVNRAGRPTHVDGRCEARCNMGVGAYLGSADAWRYFIAERGKGG